MMRPLLLLVCRLCLVVGRDLTVITVATRQTEGYSRFLRSADNAGLEVRTLGLGQEWQGGDMNYPGGGWKVNLLKEEMEGRKEDTEGLVMFTDSYDVVIAAGKDAIIAQYESFQAKIVFGAENFCWPDTSLKSRYPEVEEGMRFLNSGGFIGPASLLYQMLQDGGEIKNLDDDQLFYTKIYIDPELREKYSIILDHRAELFQNLNGEQDNVELRFASNEPYVENLVYSTKPMVIHGNGPSKLLLNNLGNYLAHSWDLDDGCLACWENNLELKNLVEEPKVLMAIFIEKPTPFMEEFWSKIESLKYDKSNIDLYVHNSVEFHKSEVSKFVNDHQEEYHNVEVAGSEDMTEWHARNAAVERCRNTKCDFLFVVDSEAHLDNPHSLRLLIEQNRAVVAPMLYRPYTAWSNFWGSLSSDGYYARSADYMEIVNNNRRGLWNVPYITSCYLVSGTIIHDEETTPNYINNMMDPDMAFTANLRAKDVFMFVSNRLNFGHLVNNEAFSTDHLHPELWEVERNKYDWELRYLHPNHSKSLEADTELEEPCPDVYWFPVFTEKFCQEFVAEAEHFGVWSDGSNSDSRLESGYEAVPTRDIHMNQIGYDTEWLYILDTYIRPLQEHVFVGYFHRPPRSMMNFIVRYKPDEQPNLKPHHDSSTYTINVALNRVGVDYEVNSFDFYVENISMFEMLQGGGCRFLRYDCQVVDTRMGWIFMHPGRLTHYHEGLYTTKGTRYIMISFVDP